MKAKNDEENKEHLFHFQSEYKKGDIVSWKKLVLAN
jgi:hypothetical protein